MTKTADEFLDDVKRELGQDPDEVLTLSVRMLSDLLVMAGALNKAKDRYHPGELEVPCSQCEASAWEECRAKPKTGVILPAPHQARRELAKRLWESRRRECTEAR